MRLGSYTNSNVIRGFLLVLVISFQVDQILLFPHLDQNSLSGYLPSQFYTPNRLDKGMFF